MTQFGRFFCSAASRNNGELFYGTAPRIDSWLLLEYPEVWPSRAMAGSRLPEPVKRHLEELLEHPRHRQLLIRRSHVRSQTVQGFFVNSSESSPALTSFEISDYEVLTRFGPGAVNGVLAAKNDPEPLYAVCTHGNHDKCCAKFGLPVFAALVEHAGGRAWQCSHVGGDRFAANVVCFPHGIYYGRVLPDDVPLIVQAYSRGQIYLKNYRGRSCHPRAAQIAEYFLRVETAMTGLSDFRFLPPVEKIDGIWRVRFESVREAALHTIEFRALEQRLEQYLTCNASETTPVMQYELASYSVMIVS
jgi:hypothetical protein